MRPAVVLLAGAAALLPGCGSATSTTSTLGAADSSLLHRDVGSARAAALAHHPAVAHAALGTLRADIRQMLGQHRLSGTDARVLLVEAERADGRVSVEVHRDAASAPAVSIAPSPVTTSPPAATGDGAVKPAGQPGGKGDGNGQGNGDGHGKGKGHGGD